MSQEQFQERIARIQAQRAKALLQAGSAEWTRADDIVASLAPRD